MSLFDEIYSDDESKKLADEFAKIIENSISKSVDIKGGIPISNENTIEITRKAIKEFTKSKAYKDSLAKFVYNVEKSVKTRLDQYGKEKIYVTRKDINVHLKLAISEYLSTMEEFGLNTQFNQPIRKLIYENLRLRKPLSELTKSMNNLIKGSGENIGLFQKHAKQNAQTAASAYTGIINQSVVSKYEDRIKGFEITGTLIETSSPQCKKFIELGRRLSLKTIKKEIMPLAVENGFAGKETDILKIPTLLLHWGCRHEFTPLLTENNLR